MDTRCIIPNEIWWRKKDDSSWIFNWIFYSFVVFLIYFSLFASAFNYFEMEWTVFLRFFAESSLGYVNSPSLLHSCFIVLSYSSIQLCKIEKAIEVVLFAQQRENEEAYKIWKKSHCKWKQMTFSMSLSLSLLHAKQNTQNNESQSLHQTDKWIDEITN